MGDCIYNDFNGKCQMYEQGDDLDNYGCDEEGYCVCENDENPEDTCFYYESIMTVMRRTNL